MNSNQKFCCISADTYVGHYNGIVVIKQDEDSVLSSVLIFTNGSTVTANDGPNKLASGFNRLIDEARQKSSPPGY